MIFFSPSLLSFFHPDFSENIPIDAVIVSDEQFLTFSGVIPAGKCLSSDDSGLPILIDDTSE